jgi:hypothetical protein
MVTSMQVPVSMRALLQRINRKLAKDGAVLKTLRGQRYAHDLGRYYSVDLVRGRYAFRLSNHNACDHAL